MPDSNGRFIPELWWSADVVSRLSETSFSYHEDRRTLAPYFSSGQIRKRSRAFPAKEAFYVQHSLSLSTHENAPLAESRRRYLEHLAAQGAAIHTIRAAAGVIYRAAMMMDLDQSSPVEPALSGNGNRSGDGVIDIPGLFEGHFVEEAKRRNRDENRTGRQLLFVGQMDLVGANLLKAQ